MGQLALRQPHDLIFDSRHQFARGTRIVRRDPCMDAFKLALRGRLKSDLHAPDDRKRLNTSSAGILFGLG